MTNAPVIVTAESHSLLMNRERIEENTVCILIDSPENKRELIKKFSDSDLNFLNCIIGFFDDVEDDLYGHLLTINQANGIVDFVKKSVEKGRNRIIVSCPSGMWISKAIACAIDAYFLGRELAISKWLATGEFLPNSYVLLTMLDAFDLRTGRKYWKDAILKNRYFYEKMNFPSLDIPFRKMDDRRRILPSRCYI